MKTKTCPHCNETALRDWVQDITISGTSDLEAWMCEDCGRTFFTYTDKEEMNE